jgi:hypothetical protein
MARLVRVKNLLDSVVTVHDPLLRTENPQVLWQNGSQTAHSLTIRPL